MNIKSITVSLLFIFMSHIFTGEITKKTSLLRKVSSEELIEDIVQVSRVVMGKVGIANTLKVFSYSPQVGVPLMDCLYNVLRGYDISSYILPITNILNSVVDYVAFHKDSHMFKCCNPKLDYYNKCVLVFKKKIQQFNFNNATTTEVKDFVEKAAQESIFTRDFENIFYNYQSCSTKVLVCTQIFSTILNGVGYCMNVDNDLKYFYLFNSINSLLQSYFYGYRVYKRSDTTSYNKQSKMESAKKAFTEKLDDILNAYKFKKGIV